MIAVDNLIVALWYYIYFNLYVWLVWNIKQFSKFFIQDLVLENDCCISQNTEKMKMV